MRYIVCYDIADDRRRDRVSTLLLNYGRRIQESVFLAVLDEELLARMLERLEREIERHADAVHVFGLCAACGGKVRVLGLGEMPEEQEFYIV